MSSQTKEIVTERTDAARSVHRPGEESSKLKPGSCEELGKASVKVRPRLVRCVRRCSHASDSAMGLTPIVKPTARRMWRLGPPAGCSGCSVGGNPGRLPSGWRLRCRADGVSNSTPQFHGRSDRKPRACPQCIEKHGYNRSAPECHVHFDAYKECRKKETASRQGLKSFFGSG